MCILTKMGSLRCSPFLALLCVWFTSTSTCNSTSNNTAISPSEFQQKNVLYFLALLPSRPVQFAVELINRRNDILEDYEILAIMESSGCATNSHLLSFTEGAFYKQAIAVIGPTCTTSSLQLSTISNHEEVSLINVHLSNVNVLEDRVLYPYSFGMVASSYAHQQVFFALTKIARWNRIAIIYSETINNHNIQEVEQLPQVLPDTKVVFSSTIFDTYLPLSEIQKTNARVVFVQANAHLIQKILCLAYHQDLLFPTYQFVFLGTTVALIDIIFLYDGKIYSCSANELAVAANGFIFSFEMLTPINYTEFGNKQLNVPEGVTLNPSEAVAFDTVLSLALALNSSLQNLHERNLSLSQYQYGQMEVTDVIRDQLYNVDFEGLSGRIKFNPENGFVDRPVSIVQCIDASIVNIAYVLSGNYVTLQPAVLIDDSFQEVYISMELPIAIIITAVLVTQLLVIMCTHTMTYVYRDHRSIKASNLRLNNLVYAGCYFFVFTGFLLVAERTIQLDFTTHTILCNASFAWMQFTGNTLVFGTLLVRMWKLSRIFKSSSNLRKAGRSVSDPVLFGLVILFVAVDILICTIWTVVDPLQPRRLEIEATPVIVTYDTKCHSQYVYIWFSILVSYNATLVFGSFYIAFSSRKRVHLRKFNTLNYHVILLVYLTTLIFVIGIPIMALTILSNDVNSTAITVSIVLILAVFCCLVLLFLPPLIPIIKQKRSTYNTSFANITSIMTRVHPFTTVTPCKSNQAPTHI